MPSDNNSTMKDIAEIVAAGKCILFLGAGVHYPPPEELVKERPEFTYPQDSRPPLGAALSNLLARQTNFRKQFPNDEINNLQRVSQHFEKSRGRAKLVSELQKAVHHQKKPSPLLGMLAQLNFPIIITTNYDNLFEEALRKAGKQPSVSVYKKNEELEEPTQDYPYDHYPTPEIPFVFKMHGDVNEGESIVITEEDYIHFMLRMSDKQKFYPIPDTILYHFKKWSTLFIGYSLRDYNLRLLFKTLRWKVDRSGFPLAYSVDKKPDPLVLDIYYNKHRYVNFVALDIWKFVPNLVRAVEQQK